MNHPDLIIVEGPAGSGKSTLIEQMVTDNIGHEVGLPDNINIPRPRAYRDNNHGVILSLVKDSAMVATALFDRCVGGTRTPPILDRGYLSQLVYGTLRRGGQALPTVTLTYINMMLLHISAMRTQILLRTGFPQSIEPFDVLVIMNLPSLSNLRTRRKYSPKHYPYGALSEWELYNQIASSLVFYNTRQIRDVRMETLIINDDWKGLDYD